MNFPLRFVIEYAHTKENEVDVALKKYFGKEGLPPEREVEIWSLFSEWLMFDFKQSNHMTFF